VCIHTLVSLAPCAVFKLILTCQGKSVHAYSAVAVLFTINANAAVTKAPVREIVSELVLFEWRLVTSAHVAVNMIEEVMALSAIAPNLVYDLRISQINFRLFRHFDLFLFIWHFDLFLFIRHFDLFLFKNRRRLRIIGIRSVVDLLPRKRLIIKEAWRNDNIVLVLSFSFLLVIGSLLPRKHLLSIFSNEIGQGNIIVAVAFLILNEIGGFNGHVILVIVVGHFVRVLVCKRVLDEGRLLVNLLGSV
jgi:hypothetical protein